MRKPSGCTDSVPSKGDSIAMYNLGKRYNSGNGVEKDLAKAKWWLTLSVEQGHADAQRLLDQF
eukprot:m.342400 g.342400  ORF g.342400 m.342400 type:complete len:63 (+) comp16549_c0_seq1:477-665(+)